MLWLKAWLETRSRVAFVFVWGLPPVKAALEASGDMTLATTVALRLQPCPARATARFAAATASEPFRQGPNLVRVCAADYAVTTAANRSSMLQLEGFSVCAKSCGSAISCCQSRRWRSHSTFSSNGFEPSSL